MKRGTGDKIKTMTKLILPIVDTTGTTTGSINYRYPLAGTFLKILPTRGPAFV